LSLPIPKLNICLCYPNLKAANGAVDFKATPLSQWVFERIDLVSNKYEDNENLERKTIEYLRTVIEEKGYTGRGVASVKGRIGGFFSNNSKRYALDLRKLKVSKARRIAKYSPTNEEVRHLYGLADCSRDRLMIALMYQNGLCPVDLSLLEVGDLPLDPWMYYEKCRRLTQLKR
jgi:integrase